MELTAERDQYFPTSTPVLDAHRPFSGQTGDRMSTGNSVFISSAVILAFTALPSLRSLLDVFSSHPVLIWIAFALLPLLAFVTALAIHEAGHLCAARLIGFETVQVKFGPFLYTAKQPPQCFLGGEVFGVGGAVMRPAGSIGLKRRLFYLVVGGSLANVGLALALEAAAYFLPLGMAGRFALHLFGTTSALVGLAALVPELNPSGEFSDGARLIMLAKNDSLAARWLAIVEIQLAANAGAHPRDWDETLMTRVLAEKDESVDCVVGTWLAYLWAAGRQEITLATKYLEETLSMAPVSPRHMRDPIFMEAAVFQSWFRHNSAKGRFWASHIRNQESLGPLQTLRLDIALRWADGQSFHAWEMLGEYLVQLSEMPASPQREMAEKNALEWKMQMESRMLAGAWATMHTWSQKLEAQSRA